MKGAEATPGTMETLRNFIISECGASDSIEANDDLLRMGILDSLMVLRIVSFIEEEWGVLIDDSEITVSNFQNLVSMTTLVEEKKNGS